MTLSACSSTDCGIASPSALAVFMLSTNSNFVGCSISRPAGSAQCKWALGIFHGLRKDWPARYNRMCFNLSRLSNAMGTFSVGCRIENSVDRSRSVTVRRILVDTGSEYTWVSGAMLKKIGVAREKKDVEFIMANGQRITRSVGFAIVRVERSFTIDEIVFAEKGDLLLLGARSLEGLNLAVDPRRKRLVAAGPVPVA